MQVKKWLQNLNFWVNYPFAVDAFYAQLTDLLDKWLAQIPVLFGIIM